MDSAIINRNDGEDELFKYQEVLSIIQSFPDDPVINYRNYDFVHYTRADSAIKILNDECFWMRNACLMNDSSEVRYGAEVLRGILINENDSINIMMKKVLSDIEDGLFCLFKNRVLDQLAGLLDNTYILSLSRHSVDEDKYGRLSMWRAYSGQCGVALVFNKEAVRGLAVCNGIYFSPVFYADESRIRSAIEKIIKEIGNKTEIIRGIRSFSFSNILVEKFLGLCLSVKHPVFKEEAECRVVFNKEISNKLISAIVRPSVDIECLNGVPQKVFKLNMKNTIYDGGIGRLLKKIIIGPSNDGEHIRGVFQSVLEKKGVDVQEEKIILSNIPLRI